jgi:hypothetical protein
MNLGLNAKLFKTDHSDFLTDGMDFSMDNRCDLNSLHSFHMPEQNKQLGENQKLINDAGVV